MKFAKIAALAADFTLEVEKVGDGGASAGPIEPVSK